MKIETFAAIVAAMSWMEAYEADRLKQSGAIEGYGAQPDCLQEVARNCGTAPEHVAESSVERNRREVDVTRE